MFSSKQKWCVRGAEGVGAPPVKEMGVSEIEVGKWSSWGCSNNTLETAWQLQSVASLWILEADKSELESRFCDSPLAGP